MKKKLIIIVALLWVVIGLIVTVVFLIPMFSAMHEDDWYLAEVEATVIDYIESGEFEDGRIRVYRYVAKNYDRDIAIANRDREEKLYPFTVMSVYVEIGLRDYIFTVEVSEQGELEVIKYEYYKG